MTEPEKPELGQHDAPPAIRDAGESHESLVEDEQVAPRGVRTMAVVRWALVALMAIAAASTVLYYFGAFKGHTSASAAKYYCPMHPSVTQDHPGECPICSMTLVKKESSGAAGSSGPMPPKPREGSGSSPEGSGSSPTGSAEMKGMPGMPMGGMRMEGESIPIPRDGGSVPGLTNVELTPERIQLMGMRTGRVLRQKLAPELRTVGFVTANEQGLAQIHTRFAGWIERLLVSQTGQRVTRGQVLATIYSPELLNAQQELLNARNWSKASGGTTQAGQLTAGLAEDAQRRLELLGISREDIQEMERTGKPVRALRIRSPVEGYVTRKNAFEGLYAQPGTQLFEIANLSTVWVIADVYEYELQRIRVGEKARLQLAAYPGQTFTGRVDFIYPTVDPNSRTLRVRLEFKNRELKLKPGMYGDVVIDLPGAEGLVVPAEAVVDTGETQYVFLALPGGHFEPRQVRLGIRSGNQVEVVDGVSEGDTVVTTANFLIDSESRLRAAIAGQGTVAGAGATPSAAGQGPNCEADLDRNKFPEKYQQCRACEIQHRGMGTMEEDCKKIISKPWR